MLLLSLMRHGQQLSQFFLSQWTLQILLKRKISKGINPYLYYVPNIRYAEVLLNAAEAEAESGNLTRATALLQAVHGRSDATFEFTSISTKADLVRAILTERRIELLSEGFRANDVLRRGESINSFGAGAIITPSDPR
jgi:hypothetical protein